MFKLRMYHYHIRIISFKQYFERLLIHKYSKQVILLVQNIYTAYYNKKIKRFNISRKPFSYYANAIYWDLKKQYFSLVTQRFVNLLAIAVSVGNVSVMLQWLYYQLSQIKKHHVFLSHQKIVNLFTGALTNLVYVSGLLGGYTFQITGKVNGASRTRKLRYHEGYSLKRQCLGLKFNYDFINIPTYAGILGIRLWYLF